MFCVFKIPEVFWLIPTILFCTFLSGLIQFIINLYLSALPTRTSACFSSEHDLSDLVLFLFLQLLCGEHTLKWPPMSHTLAQFSLLKCTQNLGPASNQRNMAKTMRHHSLKLFYMIKVIGCHFNNYLSYTSWREILFGGLKKTAVILWGGLWNGLACLQLTASKKSGPSA